LCALLHVALQCVNDLIPSLSFVVYCMLCALSHVVLLFVNLLFMRRYLRKAFFPYHRDLKFAGLLNPLDCPHHVRAHEQTPYREGVTNGTGKDGNATADIGLRMPCFLDRPVEEGMRVTVQVDHYPPEHARGSSRHPRGTVVSPIMPRVTEGTYWGYETRLAQSLTEVSSQ
jgi:predicted SPOUT superfamily RNA methylase MTH1